MKNIFLNLEFLNHRLFIRLRDSYLNLLQQWRNDEQLNETACFLFQTIPNLFLKISNDMSEKNLIILKELILYRPILNELNLCLEEIALNGKYLQDPQIKSLDSLFRAIQHLQRNHLDNKTNPLLTKFYDNIVKCICSSSFIDIFIHSTTQENNHPGEIFLLDTCTDYIYSYPINQQHKQSLLDIRQSLLRPFSQWFNHQSPSFRLWNTRISDILRSLCFLLTLSLEHNPSINLDKEIFDDYCQLIDSFLNILYSIFQTEDLIKNKLIQILIEILIPSFYRMTLSNQLEKYCKSKYIIFLIFKLMDIDNDQIQLNVFQILSRILTEQDTKNISNSINIAKLFIKFLTKIIDDSDQILSFYTFLGCLKHIIHYDQIKDELAKQNGIPVLLRCATETKSKPALEILLALTFNKEAFHQLNKNLDHIKPLLSSPHQDVSRTVDSLLWRFEEILPKSKLPNNTYKYNLMILYSHSNKDLIYRIYDQLIKDNFHVWIDHNQTTMTNKVQIMEQSEYILICMSDEYKQNSYCRCETSYAYQCQYKIIPLIVTFNFHPDGWLNDIINGKIYIDFIKLDFDLAYRTLKSEFIYPIIEQIPSLPIKIEYPSGIKQWTRDDVKLFLIENQFHCLLPIISEMNGSILYDLYTMCTDNRESMFHTLKNEISFIDKNLQPLTLLIYLRFLSEVEKCVSRINHN